MRIYFDHNATTPLHDEVMQAMTQVLRETYGNPSSTHREGAQARRLLEEARESVATLLNARPSQLVFTASATEANNSVISHVLRAQPGAHVVTTAIEHPSVMEPLTQAQSSGAARVTKVPVDEMGLLRLEDLQAALDEDTALLSVILANNETGVVQDISAIATLAAERGVPLHLDATQAVGKIPVDCAKLGAQWLVGSAHKFNGPKGAGFLFVREGSLAPFIHGGPQEKRQRGGTENLAGIVGLGRACALAQAEMQTRSRHVQLLRDRLWEGIEKGVPGVTRNGCSTHVLPNSLNVEFQDTAGEILLEALDGEGIAVSAGAACHSGSIDPSHVLLAMGRSAAQARSALRFSLGPSNRIEEVDCVLGLLPEMVSRVRKVPV